MRRLCLAVLIGLVPQVAAGAVPQDEVVARIEDRYAKIDDLEASFSQSAFNPTLNKTTTSAGTVYLKRSGGIRWEYRTPAPQQIVSDGKSIWVYTPELNQVSVGEAPRVMAGPAGSFLAGLGKLRKFFTVSRSKPAEMTDENGNYRIDLEPRRPEPAFARLVLVVDRNDYLVRAAQVDDQFGNTVTMKFTRIVTNSGLPDRLFAFVTPKGVATVPMQGTWGSVPDRRNPPRAEPRAR